MPARTTPVQWKLARMLVTTPPKKDKDWRYLKDSMDRSGEPGARPGGRGGERSMRRHAGSLDD